MLLKIFNIILWFMVGVLSMLNPKISKASYFLCWFMLMLYMISYYFIS